MTCSCSTCFYCDAPLSVRHEHDHMPVPARHEGTAVVPACINCHDLKDRVALSNWSPDLLMAGWVDMTPTARIYAARVYALLMDLRAEREAVA